MLIDNHNENNIALPRIPYTNDLGCAIDHDVYHNTTFNSDEKSHESDRLKRERESVYWLTSGGSPKGDLPTEAFMIAQFTRARL